MAPGILAERAPGESGALRGQTRAISAKGLELTQGSEQFIDHLYDDAANLCTIGYGHLLPAKRACDGSEPAEFRPRITLARGQQLLAADMQLAEQAVSEAIRSDSLTDGQYGALCDFVFNVGARNFKSSTLLRVINNGELERVPTEFRRWTFAKGKEIRGLLKRRNAEIGLFFDGKVPPVGKERGFQPPAIDIIEGETRLCTAAADRR